MTITKTATTTYYGENPSKTIGDDLSELQQRFGGWQQQVLVWDKMEFPPKPEVEAKTSSKNMSHSTYVSILIRAAQVTYTNRMDRAEPYIEVALEEVGDEPPGEEQARKSAAVERACYGFLNVVNMKAVRQVKATSLLRQLYASSGNPGKIVQFLHNRKKKDGTSDPVWEILDPYSCYHDFEQTPFRFVREYYQKASTIKAQFEALDADGYEDGIAVLMNPPKTNDGKLKDVHVVDHWVALEVAGKPEVWNAMTVEGKCLFVRKTRFKRRPFQIIVTNSSPRTYQNLGTGGAQQGLSSPTVSLTHTEERMLHHAEPFWAPLEPTMEQFSEGMSLLMKAVALMVNMPFTHTSQTGNQVFGNSKLSTPGAEITLSKDIGEELEILQVVRQVPDALSVLNYLVSDMERIVPSAIFGQTAAASESGYLYDKRSRDAALVAFADPARAASMAIQMGLEELLEQFREDSMQIKLNAIETNGDSAGKMWFRNFKSSDIPDSFVMRVRVAPELPDDDAKAAQIASMLKQGGLMDDRMIMSKILGIKDPLATMERIRQGRAADMPQMDMLRAIENLQIEADDNRARAAETDNAAFKRLYRFTAARLDEWRMAFERQMTGGQAAPNAQAGKILNGPSPEVLPPEQYANPDDAAGAMGEVSSSTKGAPKKGSEE